MLGLCGSAIEGFLEDSLAKILRKGMHAPHHLHFLAVPRSFSAIHNLEPLLGTLLSHLGPSDVSWTAPGCGREFLVGRTQSTCSSVCAGGSSWFSRCSLWPSVPSFGEARIGSFLQGKSLLSSPLVKVVVRTLSCYSDAVAIVCKTVFMNCIQS